MLSNFEIMPKNSVGEVRFFYSQAKPTIRNRKRLKEFIISIFQKEQKKLDLVSFIFTSDSELRKINKQFLSHDYYTDIITFDLSDNVDSISGEVYISYNRVKENALKYGTSIATELHRVIFHGALHLCGYKDKRPREIKDMRGKEDHYLSKYFA